MPLTPSVPTRRDLLEMEALTLTEAFGLQFVTFPPESLFLSAWRISPSGRTGHATYPAGRRHFLTVPCSSLAAVGRMTACLSRDDSQDVTHHEEGHCPYRDYSGTALNG